MAFGITKFLKSIIVREENTSTPKAIQITPGGSASTTTTITSSQTTNKTLTLPDATDTLVGTTATQSLSNKTITSSTIDSTIIGGTTPAAGTFTTISATSATIGGANLVTDTGTQTLTNKSLVDNSTSIVDNSDATKKILFDAAGTTSTSTTLLSSQTTNRVLTLPDATDTLVGKATTDTFTNKTLTSPTINTPSISGGTINNTSVGATTPSTGAFTSATTTSDLTVGGNLTVNGTTTTLNTQTLDVADANITINKNGNDTSSEGSGLTIDRTGTKGSLIYKNASATKFALGDLASEVDVVGISSTQTLTNKTLQFLQQSVATDSTTTGSATTLASFTTGIVRLTNASLVSLSGIPAGASGQSLIIENKTGVMISILNQDSGTTAANRILTGTANAITMATDSTSIFIYDSTSSRWQLNSGSGSGSGSSGSKNYLSTVITSQSTTPNTGNGNFELGSTTGWSLGTVGTLTNNIPTGTPTFGSGASGNLSISTVSSGQLAGSYSLSYTSSTATTQGNMLASDTFNIDTEDQAKVLTFKFYYKAQTNPTNGNFSGTSSNSFAVAAWDVTNNAWLGLAGNFGMTQNSGVGIASGTFQTASNTTQIRFVIYNANASAGAITMYFDDFFVGPQTAPIGAVITDWIAYTPAAFGGLIAFSAEGFFWRRIGDSMEIKGTVATTTVATTTIFTIPLPSGYSIDSNKNATTTDTNSHGQVYRVNGTTADQYPTITGGPYVAFSDTSNSTTVLYVSQDVASSRFSRDFSDELFVSGGRGRIEVSGIPISGWSSNVQMSNDTDTRVLSARYHGATATVIASYSDVTWSTQENDTHGILSTTTITTPITGKYKFTGQLFLAGTGALNTTADIQLLKNGATTVAESQFVYAGAITAAISIPFNFQQIDCIAGDTFKIQVKSGATVPVISASNSENYIQVERSSGPSVIAANESVAASAYLSTNAAASTTVSIPFDTKEYDSHGAFSIGAGAKFTAPISGVYSIQSFATANTSAYIMIYKNGSVYKLLTQFISGSSAAQGATSIKLLAGEFMDLRPSTSVTMSGAALSSATAQCQIAITRTGNY